MEAERLFVVIRAVGDDLVRFLHPEEAAPLEQPWMVAVFETLDEATQCYEENAYVVRNAPGEGPNDDPTIVTGCALYAVDTLDRETASMMTREGRGVLMEAEEWPPN